MSTADHVTTVSGLRWHGEGTYTVTCSCGVTLAGLAYHRDAKLAGTAHVAQVAAGIAPA